MISFNFSCNLHYVYDRHMAAQIRRKWACICRNVSNFLSKENCLFYVYNHYRWRVVVCFIAHDPTLGKEFLKFLFILNALVLCYFGETAIRVWQGSRGYENLYGDSHEYEYRGGMRN